jgi:hypothetical protein
MPTDANPLLMPETTALLLIDQQAGLAFGVSSIDRQTLLNNTIALAKTAVVFKLPVVVSTSASKVYSGPLMPALAQALPGVQPIERRNMNLWEDDATRKVVTDTGRRRLLVSGLPYRGLRVLSGSIRARIRIRGLCGSGCLRGPDPDESRPGTAANGVGGRPRDFLDPSSARIPEGLDTARNLRRRTRHRRGARRWLRHRTRVRARHDPPCGVERGTRLSALASLRAAA